MRYTFSTFSAIMISPQAFRHHINKNTYKIQYSINGEIEHVMLLMDYKTTVVQQMNNSL